MATRRLFVGNLHQDVSAKDLESRFATFGQVGQVDLRNKNEATFAFIDIKFTDEDTARKCVDVLNNTKWKGLLLKVQLAKENFMEKLKRERGDYRTQTKPRYEKPKLPDNFDFEIVSSQQKPEPRERLIANFRETISKEPPLSTPTAPPKPEPKPKVLEEPKKQAVSPSKPKPEPKPLKRKPVSSDSDSSSSEEEEPEHDGIPRFRGLAFYPQLLRQPSPPKEPAVQTESGGDAPPAEPPKEKFGLKLNPRKKLKSDQLRVQSLDSRQRLQDSRSNLIRQALSQIDLQPPPAEAEKKVSKENTAFLFGEEEEEEEESLSLSIKPQYEGAVGQKILQLKSTFGSDARFRMDERFAETNPENGDEVSEKAAQLDILGQILGPGESNKTSGLKTKPADLSSTYVRFDPTLPHHQKFTKTKGEEKKEKVSKPKKEKEEEKALEDKLRIEEEKEKLKDLTAKPTFKVAENLKSLFASESGENKRSFSLLAAFGAKSEESKKSPTEFNGGGSEEKQRKEFWTKNPFKYDSSDDEEDDAGKSNTTKRQEPARNYFKEDLFKGDRLFFKRKDERLKSVFAEFLRTTEDLEEVTQKFNEGGRTELKAIAKSKWKNSRRKNEKKIKIMRLVRKKKRREALKKQKSSKSKA